MADNNTDSNKNGILKLEIEFKGHEDMLKQIELIKSLHLQLKEAINKLNDMKLDIEVN